MSSLLDILSSPEKWTKGCEARNKLGKQTDPLGPAACTWCLMGAMAKASNGSYSKYCNMLNKLKTVLISRKLDEFPANFNDNQNTTYEDIVALIKEAGV